MGPFYNNTMDKIGNLLKKKKTKFTDLRFGEEFTYF